MLCLSLLSDQLSLMMILHQTPLVESFLDVLSIVFDDSPASHKIFMGLKELEENAQIS
jgi:hypothetical protein